MVVGYRSQQQNATQERKAARTNLVDDFEPSRVPEDLQTDSEALPEEPQRGEHDLSIGPVLLGINGHEEKRAWLEGSIEVDLLFVLLDGRRRVRRRGRREDGSSGFLSGNDLGGRGGEELFDDELDGGNVGRLGDVPGGELGKEEGEEGGEQSSRRRLRGEIR